MSLHSAYSDVQSSTDVLFSIPDTTFAPQAEFFDVESYLAYLAYANRYENLSGWAVLPPIVDERHNTPLSSVEVRPIDLLLESAHERSASTQEQEGAWDEVSYAESSTSSTSSSSFVMIDEGPFDTLLLPDSFGQGSITSTPASMGGETSQSSLSSSSSLNSVHEYEGHHSYMDFESFGVYDTTPQNWAGGDISAPHRELVLPMAAAATPEQSTPHEERQLTHNNIESDLANSIRGEPENVDVVVENTHSRATGPNGGMRRNAGFYCFDRKYGQPFSLFAYRRIAGEQKRMMAIYQEEFDQEVEAYVEALKSDPSLLFGGERPRQWSWHL
ncbi:hypothetical protein BJ912DRAFT_554849 [Pholiota molesta]|nr:hypothetical protein BJ912DRAFT_554849 [Pholiota molesta]